MFVIALARTPEGALGGFGILDGPVKRPIRLLEDCRIEPFYGILVDPEIRAQAVLQDFA